MKRLKFLSQAPHTLRRQERSPTGRKHSEAFRSNVEKCSLLGAPGIATRNIVSPLSLHLEILCGPARLLRVQRRAATASVFGEARCSAQELAGPAVASAQLLVDDFAMRSFS